MQKIYTVFVLLALVACKDMGGANPIDAKKFLESLEGPKVPTVNDALLEGAKNAEKQGDYASAIQVYQQILDKRPEDKEAMFGLAESYRRQGDNDRAIALYDILLAKNAEDLSAKEGKGLALMGKGDFDTPGPLFEQVLKVDAKRWKTLNALGILFTTRNMHPEAQQYFTQALKYAPSNTSVMNNLGLSQALEKRYDVAAATLTQASALTAPASNDRKRIDLNLSLVYAVAGRLDDAQAIAEQYFTDAALNNNLGLYAHLAKDDQLAKSYLNMALTESKTFYERAWENLQAIDSSSTQAMPDLAPASAPAPVVLPEPQPLPANSPFQPAVPPETVEKPIEKPVAEKPKPKPKPKKDVKPSTPKTPLEEDLTNIVGSTREEPKFEEEDLPKKP